MSPAITRGNNSWKTLKCLRCAECCQFRYEGLPCLCPGKVEADEYVRAFVVYLPGPPIIFISGESLKGRLRLFSVCFTYLPGSYCEECAWRVRKVMRQGRCTKTPWQSRCSWSVGSFTRTPSPLVEPWRCCGALLGKGGPPKVVTSPNTWMRSAPQTSRPSTFHFPTDRY